MVDLKSKPFYLTETEVALVETTLKNMNIKEKIGQLFFLQGLTTRTQILGQIINQINPGGMVFRKSTVEELRALHNYAQRISKTPLFLGADVDCGSSEIIEGGFNFGNNLLLAATDSVELATKAAEITAKEIRNVGLNVVFGPNVDIDYNWRSSLKVNNTFGTDAKLVANYAEAQIQQMRENNILSLISQFPGHGVDERDSHLISPVNHLDVDEWESNYGYIYKRLIDAGVRAISVSNISLPEYVKKIDPKLGLEVRNPVSISKELLQGLLKDRFGFNGLIISDTTMLTGFSIGKKRSDVLPLAVACGCDMIICTKDYIKDYKSILQGCKSGVITEARLNEAVTKILAAKVSLKLYEEEIRFTDEKFFDTRVHTSIAKDIADCGVTLLKDHVSTLPINPNMHRKVLLFDVSEIGKEGSQELIQTFKEGLEYKGCIVEQRRFDYQSSFMRDGEFEEDLRKKYDLVIVILNLSGTKLSTAMKLDLLPEIALKSPLYTEEIPSIFISFGNPYHSYDVPMVKTFINAYSSDKYIVEAVVKKLFGDGEFKGKSPVATIFDYFGNQVKIDESKIFKPGMVQQGQNQSIEKEETQSENKPGEQVKSE